MKAIPKIKAVPAIEQVFDFSSPVTQHELYRVKFQRPLFTSAAKPMLLAYSQCGTICPTMLPETEDLRNLLGSRPKAYFLCRLEGADLVIAGETHNDNW